MKVLIVDDEEMIRSLAEKILRRAGYDVVAAADGFIGVEMYTQHKDDIRIILMDIMMEGMSGLDTLRLIRKQSETVPCIVSSGNVSDLDDIPSDLSRHVYFLQKPYRANQLSEMVDGILSDLT